MLNVRARIKTNWSISQFPIRCECDRERRRWALKNAASPRSRNPTWTDRQWGSRRRHRASVDPGAGFSESWAGVRGYRFKEGWGVAPGVRPSVGTQPNDWIRVRVGDRSRIGSETQPPAGDLDSTILLPLVVEG